MTSSFTTLFLAAIAASAACGSKKAGQEKATQETEDYLEGLNGYGILGTAYQTTSYLEGGGPDHCDYVQYAYDGLADLNKQVSELPARPPGLRQCTMQIQLAVNHIVAPITTYFEQGLAPCGQFLEMWTAQKDAVEKALCELRSARDLCASEAKAAKATTEVDEADFCFPVESGDPVPLGERKEPVPAPPPPPP